MRIIFNTLPMCLATTTLGVFGGVSLWSAYWVFVYDRVHIYAEHGLLESTQAIFLAIAMLAFLIPVLLNKRLDKLILVSCALLSYSFLLRELDVKHQDIHEALKMLGSGIGRKVTLVMAFGAIAIYGSFRFSYYKNVIFYFLRSSTAILLIMGGTFLVAGDFFEKMNSIHHHVFFEEVSELFGYTCILLSAFAVNSCYYRSIILLNK